MGTTFSTLSHGLQQATAGSFQTLGHVHQVLAAALGYNSFAGYKTSSEEQPEYDGARHVVLARHLVQQRLAALGYPAVPAALDAAMDAIESVFRHQLPDAEVHTRESDVGDSISEAVAQEIEDSGTYSGEIAITNAFGGYFDLEFNAPTSIDSPATEWVLDVSGTSTLDQDPEAVYHGHVIDVRAIVVCKKLGRRVLAEPDVTEIGASIQDPGFEEEPEPNWEP